MTKRVIESAFRRAVNVWRPILGLLEWQVFIRVEESEQGHCAAAVARPEYRELTLHLDPAAVSRDVTLYPTLPHIEYLALHELAHALTWVLIEDVERRMPDRTAQWHVEHVTSKIARALWVARYRTFPPEGV